MNIKTLKSYLGQIVVKLKQFVISLKSNRDLLVFLLFLFLSTGLWVLNALRKEYTTTIEYPVNYTDFPDDFILLGKPQETVELKIHSLGYNILPYYMGRILSAKDLYVSSFRRISNGDELGAYVLTRSLIKDISNHMSNGVELLSISPDTLFVKFEKKEYKKVPVVFQSELKFRSSYYQSGDITIRPDSVEISGPASYIDTTEFVYTKRTKYDDLMDSLTRNLGLEMPTDMSVNPSRVVVNIPVEPFTEKSVLIPLTLLNVPDTLQLKTFPSEVNVTFSVAVSKFNEVKSTDFEVFVDYNSYSGNNLPDRLKVKMNTNLDNIKNINYSPLFVECLFEKLIK